MSLQGVGTYFAAQVRHPKTAAMGSTCCSGAGNSDFRFSAQTPLGYVRMLGPDV